MHFADKLHHKKFQEMMRICHKRQMENDYLAAIFLLSSPLLGKKAEKYIWPGEIRFSELMERCGVWSSGEKGLLKLAASLFNSGWKADLNDIFWSLDAENVELALEALRIRFQG